MSSVTGLTNQTTPINGAVSTDTVSSSQQTLTQNDFMQLLVAQMENQDPMNPQSDTDMAAQMAQFTSLTQSSAMASSLSMMQANSLIGSTVTIQVDSQNTTSGVVQGVTMDNGTPQIVVNNTPYGVSQVVTVTPPAVSQNSNSNSNAANNNN
jgi:flagellar basal-body rod modification protein FlgD